MDRHVKNITLALVGAMALASGPSALAAANASKLLIKKEKETREIVTPRKSKLNIIAPTQENLPKVLTFIDGLRYHSKDAVDRMRDVVLKIVNEDIFSISLKDYVSASNDSLPSEFLSKSSIEGFDPWGGGVPVVVFRYMGRQKDRLIPVSLENMN